MCVSKSKRKPENSTDVIEKSYNVKKVQPAYIHILMSDVCII